MKMDQEKEAFVIGEGKFDKYIDALKGIRQMYERINGIFDYLSDNNPEILAFMFKQSLSLSDMLDGKDKKPEPERVGEAMRIFLMMIDSMSHAGYIKEDFIPEEFKIKKDGTIVEVPRKMYEEMRVANKKNSKKKKNGKK